MRLFGKKIFAKKPLTAEEQEKRQAQERLANIKRIQRIEKEQQRKAQAQADADRRYQQEQQRLTRQGNIESARTRVARERAARAAAQERKYSGYRGTLESAASVFGIKNKRHSVARQRPIYVSTSHGLRKISADDPDYYKYREQQRQSAPPPVERIVVRESNDDFEQPDAFKW